VLTRLDHLVILVRDLELASADYERLGFAVTPGGEHADGLTRNALVPFQDGTYLELVSFLDPEDPTDNVWRWRRFYPREGLIDYCAASDDLEADVKRLVSLGFGVEGPEDGGRRLPDGTNIRWRSARIRQEGRIFPFLIEDLTPRELRVPGGPETRHPNGAIGVSSLEISAPDVDSAANALAALADKAPPVRLGSCTLRTVEARDEDAQGSGPSAVGLVVGEAGGVRELDSGVTHGAGLRLRTRVR
jgi:catechol 2,3-dioxygenase-like lactoylglutathione lyase family enzyme